MEWVETTGSTVADAKDRALDQLGIDELEVEFEVLEEPKAGLFGRIRGQARVRARIAPKEPRPKTPRRQAGKKRPAAKAKDSRARGGQRTQKANSDESGYDENAAKPKPAVAAKRKKASPKKSDTDREYSKSSDSNEVDEKVGKKAEKVSGRKASGGSTRRREEQNKSGDKSEGVEVSAEVIAQSAKEYLEGLIKAMDLDGVTVDSLIEGDEVQLGINGDDLGHLIGPKGQTLQALQDLTRISTNRSVYDSDARVHVDVSGYRERRREALARFIAERAQEVLESGEEMELEPMSPSDRKVVHDTINGIDGVSTVSEGREGSRRVVILPD